MDAQRTPGERFRTRSAAETRELGSRLAAGIGPGTVIAFEGDLGAGKTCMIQGLCRALEVRDYVTSPTFILINEYEGRLRGRPIEVYHFDLYRLGSSDELEDLGAEEYFYGQGLCLIEWPERAGDLLPARRLDISLAHVGADEREITIRTRTEQG